MTSEFSRGLEVVNGIMKEKGSLSAFSKLFEPSDFFLRYNHYLAVDMMASSEDEHRAWVGWVESRLRKVTNRFRMESVGHATSRGFHRPGMDVMATAKSWKATKTGGPAVKKEDAATPPVSPPTPAEAEAAAVSVKPEAVLEGDLDDEGATKLVLSGARAALPGQKRKRAVDVVRML
ncbi:unnamed protein product [Ectocarpus sp. 4 AP-2014]